MALVKLNIKPKNNKEEKRLDVVAFFLSNLPCSCLKDTSENNASKYIKSQCKKIIYNTEDVLKKIVANSFYGNPYNALRFFAANSVEQGLSAIERMNAGELPIILISSKSYTLSKGEHVSPGRTISDTVDRILDSGYKGSVIGIDLPLGEKKYLQAILGKKISVVDSKYFNFQLEHAIYEQIINPGNRAGR